MPRQKYALISGASSGIGYQLAIEFAKRGYKVFGCTLASELHLMDDLKEHHGVVPFACDITKVEDVKAAAKLIEDQTGGYLDILYNNAGIAFGGPAIEADDDQVNMIFQVNVLGHMYMTKYMSKFVIAAKGSIIFTSSIAARVPLSWTSAYCATKAAIDQYAQVLHGELKPFGVKVHSVITGGVNTLITSKAESSSRVNQNSIYNVDGAEESLKATSGMVDKTSISPQKYAKQVIKAITCKWWNSFNIYKGYRAYTLHLLSRYAPFWLVEFAIGHHFKQLKVWRNIRKRENKKVQ